MDEFNFNEALTYPVASEAFEDAIVNVLWSNSAAVEEELTALSEFEGEMSISALGDVTAYLDGDVIRVKVPIDFTEMPRTFDIAQDGHGVLNIVIQKATGLGAVECQSDEDDWRDDEAND